MLSKMTFVAILLLAALKCVPSRSEEVHVVSPQAGIDITTTKVAHVGGEIDYPAEFAFEKQVASTISIPGPRVILINSTGGDVNIGEVMISTVLKEKDRGVKMICVGEDNVHSMAFNFLTFCDVRLGLSSMHSVVHKVANDGMPAMRLSAKNLKDIVDMLEKTDEKYRQANSKAMGLTLEQYDNFADEQHMWSAPMLYFMGYLQGIATVTTDSPEVSL